MAAVRIGIKFKLNELGLSAFQQLTGINAIIFYSSNIFEAAEMQVTGTALVGITNFAFTFVSLFFADSKSTSKHRNLILNRTWKKIPVDFRFYYLWRWHAISWNIFFPHAKR